MTSPAPARFGALALACAAALGACGRSGRSGDGPAAPGFSLADAARGLGAATDVGFLPDGRLLVTEKDGALRIAGPGGVTEAGRFAVDVESEKGLLGVLVDPDFASTRRVFLYYSRAEAAGGTDLDRHRVVSVRLSPDDTVEPGSERVLVAGLRGPANHDGGGLAIGPDGLLYIGVGDTGCNTGRPPEPPGAPGNFFATCLSNANGKILRVGLAGEIPDDNPLAAVSEATACGAVCGADVAGTGRALPRPEIWAWGFRNPWRFAFDPATGRLWVGDVGEVSYEEISVAERGRHHGWPFREGRHGWPVARCREIAPDPGDCVEPVYECRHGGDAAGIDGGCGSITGGAFLAGPRWPAAQRDLYLFGDNVTNRLWTLQLTPDRRGVVPGSRQEVAALQGAPVSIRSGPDGDVFVAVLPGRVIRISPAE